MIHRYQLVTRIALLIVLAGGCGAADISGLGGDAGDDSAVVPGDDGGTGSDGGVGDGGSGPGGCSTAVDAPKCNNCKDDDGDDLIDGADPECTGAIDNDESSFATGISGDNIDPKKQDCFFDGNSGGGQDCAWHTCCLLDNPATEANECPESLRQGYDQNECADAQTAQCIRDCKPLTPPGCDCFGCCTVCDGAGCVDILLNTNVAPECDYSTLHDAAKCFTCTKNTECGTPCNSEDSTTSECVRCPGQDEADLPDSCTAATCPSGRAACETSADCTTTQFCSSGCCISRID